MSDTEQDDDNELYMTDPQAKTLGGFITALNIFAKYCANGLDQKFGLHGEHDLIYSPCDTEQIPKNSEDGIALTKLGWHEDEDSWAYFT